MTAYHGTTEEAWALIQREGVLHGVRSPEMLKTWPDASRVTYLSQDALEAAFHGDVVLEMIDIPWENASQWQCRVYEPIPLKFVRRLTPDECAPLFTERKLRRAKFKKEREMNQRRIEQQPAQTQEEYDWRVKKLQEANERLKAIQDGPNPYALYDKPNRAEATMVMDSDMIRFGDEIKRIQKEYPDLGWGDTSARDALVARFLHVVLKTRRRIPEDYLGPPPGRDLKEVQEAGTINLKEPLTFKEVARFCLTRDDWLGTLAHDPCAKKKKDAEPEYSLVEKWNRLILARGRGLVVDGLETPLRISTGISFIFAMGEVLPEALFAQFREIGWGVHVNKMTVNSIVTFSDS